MHYDQLMKRLNVDKDRAKKDAKISSYQVTQIDKDNWQSMRDSGMSVVAIHEKIDLPVNLISAHTVKPFKSGLSYQWQDLRNYGFSVSWIADQYEISKSLVFRGTINPSNRSAELKLWREDWVKLRQAGVPAKWIAEQYGVHITYIYKIAPIKKTTVSASRMHAADLTKELLITFEGELVGTFIPLERDSNAEEKDA